MIHRGTLLTSEISSSRVCAQDEIVRGEGGFARVSAYMFRAKQNTSSGATYSLTSSGLHVAKPSELTDSLDILDDKEFPYGHPEILSHIGRHSSITPENIFTITGGTSAANFMVFEALVRPGDHVILEQIGYPLLRDLAFRKGASISEVRRSPEDNFELDLNHLEQLISPHTKLIVLTNLHNPSGTLTSVATLKLAGEIAQRRGAKILIDQVYLDAVTEGKPESASRLGDSFLVTNSLTKVYGLGFLRAGWVEGTPEFIEHLWSLYDVVGVVPPTVNDRLIIKAWEKLPEFAKRVRTLLAANHTLWNGFLDAHPDVVASRNRFGTTAFPSLSGSSAETVAKLEAHLLETYDTGIVDGKYFGAPNHFRVSLCCDTDNLIAGLERLSAAIANRTDWDV